MENNKIQNCIDACITCADACETCSTENKGAGMEHSEKLASLVLMLATFSCCKTDSNLDALCKKCEEVCMLAQLNVKTF
jgi:hypothetical protein